jgi:hypothetical protein
MLVELCRWWVVVLVECRQVIAAYVYLPMNRIDHYTKLATAKTAIRKFRTESLLRRMKRPKYSAVRQSVLW